MLLILLLNFLVILLLNFLSGLRWCGLQTHARERSPKPTLGGGDRVGVNRRLIDMVSRRAIVQSLAAWCGEITERVNHV